MLFKADNKKLKSFTNPNYPVFKNFPYRNEQKVFLPPSYQIIPTNKQHIPQDMITRNIPATVSKSNKEPISIPQSIKNAKNLNLNKPTLMNQVKTAVLVKKSHTFRRPND